MTICHKDRLLLDELVVLSRIVVEVDFAFLVDVSESDADGRLVSDLVDCDLAALRGIGRSLGCRNDIILSEAFGEVEQLVAVFEDHEDPVAFHVEVHDLHAWVELHLSCNVVSFSQAIPQNELGRREIYVVAGPNDEENVRILVGITEGRTAWNCCLDFRLSSGCVADNESFVSAC